ncbi:uncharacterized protein SCHCODRAFT_02726913 [Schizophyllum commune H4-8]|uniref:F-box domain-containing protein n=1 Tax=Schizophyllum commune (strain H4-8 / FGSC 9210) TaxID=578458 RepID=D8Q3F9_SCHCM|nr:uncharacterized protein SCHCODRAFT_02726913 [Schizophyllum commune H4-8]KAI5894873.1 hypothetical protein SCHCODRAFT_02726913 [Schizophyllum commune H4-8]
MDIDFIDPGNHTDVTMHTASEYGRGGDTAPETAESFDEHEDPDEEAPEGHALASRDSPLKTPPKRRSKAGKLAAFKELPVDVLYEILLLLNPQDLLAFARTNKYLQAILVHSECRFVWKAVRERVGYPAPREALYEYWWASLLFGRKICQICGSSPVKNIDWYLLKRVCTRCKDEQRSLFRDTEFKEEYPKKDKLVLDLVLHTPYRTTVQAYTPQKQFYLRSDVDSMLKEIAIHKRRISKRRAGAKQAFDEFKQKRIKFVEKTHDLAYSRAEWAGKVYKKTVSEGEKLGEERRAAIRERLLQLGYDERDVADAVDVDNTNMTVQKKPLTDLAWSHIRAKWVAEVEYHRSFREEKELRQRQRAEAEAERLRQLQLAARRERERIVTEIYSGWCCKTPAFNPELTFLALPLPHEIFDLSPMRELIEADANVVVDKRRLQLALEKCMPQINELWAQRHDFLRGVAARISHCMRQAGSSSLEDDSYVLRVVWTQCDFNVATPLAEEQEIGLTFSDFVFYWRFHWNELPPESQSWEVLSRVTYNKRRSLVVASLMEAMGFPRTALDEFFTTDGPRFLCMRCPSIKTDDTHGRWAMTWQAAVVHTERCHAGVDCAWQWQLLSAADTARVKALESSTHLADKVWSCSHCRVHWNNWKTFEEVCEHAEMKHKEGTKFGRMAITTQPNYIKPLPFACLREALVSKNQADDEDRTQAAILSAVQCSAEIRERLRVEAVHPYFGPENKRSILGKIVGRAMQKLNPEVETNYETVYARAVHPCYSDVSAVQILPSRGRADSVITLPVSLTEALSPQLPTLSPGIKEGRLSTESPPVVQVNIAHAPIMAPMDALDECSARALGTFDVSTDSGAAALVSLLSYHQLGIATCATKAQLHAPWVKRTLLSDRFQPWQVGLVADLGLDNCELTPESRVHWWISGHGEAESIVSTANVPPSADKGYRNEPNFGHSNIRSENFDDSEVPEELIDDAVVEGKIQKFENARRIWKSEKCKDSCEAARSSSVSSSIDILGDRYYSPAVYTPLRVPDWLSISWPDQSMCQEIRKKYLLPTMLQLPVDRIDCAYVQGSYQPLHLRGQRLVVGPVEHHSHSREFNLGHGEFEALKRFVMENTIESAMRKLDDRVLDLSQLSNDAETILLRATPAIIAASNDANQHLRKHNESEIKQQWQRILRAVVSACPNIEGRYLDAIAERATPLSRNELADDMMRGSNTLKEDMEVHAMYLNPVALAQVKHDRIHNKWRIAVSKDMGNDSDDPDDSDDSDYDSDDARDGNIDNRAVDNEAGHSDGDEFDLASRMKRSLAADQDRSLTAVHDLYTRMRDLQGQYEKQTPDENALKARLLRYFDRGSTFDGCLVWSFRGYFSEKYSLDEIKSYRFFNFDDAKQAKDSGQVAEPSKSASHAVDRAEAAVASPVAFTRTQELLGEAREVGEDSQYRAATPSTEADFVAAAADSEECQPMSELPNPEGAARELASPAIFFEYKADSKDIAACYNQARFDLIDALKYLDSRKIHNFPVFAVVVVDTVGHVITAWSEKDKVSYS